MKDLIEVMASDQFKMDQAAQGSEIGWWIVASSIHERWDLGPNLSLRQVPRITARGKPIPCKNDIHTSTLREIAHSE